MSIFSLAGGANGPPLDPQVLQALPKGPVNITLNGNTFEIVLQDQDVKVNGQELKVFVVLTALHGKLSYPRRCLTARWQLTWCASTVCNACIFPFPATISHLGCGLALLEPRRLPSR